MRHEAYIADSEKERQAMTMHIDSLEAEKHALEKRNATIIEENRSLLDQLETVNSAVTESDAHVTSLQATIQSTQQELHKLTQLAARTERLEQQLAEFEKEQATWEVSLEEKEQSERSAVRRWQKAERTLANLQEEIERIEREAKEEKERHGEIVGRMERRHAVERELGSAAGRLKGAAALKNGSSEAGGPNVVSHFVKDILQDNANLQMGIVELKDMLNNSNDEVEILRRELSLHQPADDGDEDTPRNNVARKDLREELNRTKSQELHVHHHYHAPQSTPKAPPLRRTKKKKHGVLTPGHFSPSSGSSTPRSSFSHSSPTPTTILLQQTAASLPQPIPVGKRWSTQSHQTYHSLNTFSVPSSPQSTTNRTSSLFDRVFSDAGQDSSRPTTPETEDPGSPIFVPGHTKRASGSSFRTYSAPVVSRRGISPSAGRPSLDSILSIEELPKLEQLSPTQDAIPEENEIEWENASSAPAEEDSTVTSPMSDEVHNSELDQFLYRQPLRRAASHESLLSVSGIDFHTLKSRPSQILAPYGGRSIAPQAIISDTNAHAARPAAVSRPSADSRNLLSGMAADQRPPPRPGFGKKVGGWVFGRWGATPSPGAAYTNPSPTARKTNKALSVSSGSDAASADTQATPKKPKLRPPGINQSGPIVGFGPEVKTQHAPIMKTLDEEALKNLLDGR